MGKIKTLLQKKYPKVLPVIIKTLKKPTFSDAEINQAKALATSQKIKPLNLKKGTPHPKPGKIYDATCLKPNIDGGGKNAIQKIKWDGKKFIDQGSSPCM